MQNTNKHPYTLLILLKFRFRMLCTWKTRQLSKETLQLGWIESCPRKFPVSYGLCTKSLTSLSSDFPLDSASWVFLNSNFHIFALCSAFGVGPALTPFLCCTPNPDVAFWCLDWAHKDFSSDFHKNYSVKVRVTD